MDAIVDSSGMMGEGAGSDSPPAAHTTAEDGVVSVVEDVVLPAEVKGVEEEVAEPASQKRAFADAVVPLVEFGGAFMDPNLVGSTVEVVGTNESQRGRSCPEHAVCGMALREGRYVCFSKVRFAWRDGKEEDVLEVFLLDKGLRTCKVGYLPKHLAYRADRYDGLCARIAEIYSGDAAYCDCVAKRQKYHRNVGCCVAVIVGMKDMFAIK